MTQEESDKFPPFERTVGCQSDVRVYDHLPDGWRVIDGANTAPNGYVWICNNKPMFGGEYEHGLMKIEYLPEKENKNEIQKKASRNRSISV